MSELEGGISTAMERLEKQRCLISMRPHEDHVTTLV